MSVDTTVKPSNPKDAIGSDKMPLHLWPASASVMGCLGLLDGALKYGRSNWRAVGIRASIYFDAIERHIHKLKEGEDVDEDSGLPHEAHILACAAILVDAKAAGKFIDDRMYPGNFSKFLKDLTPHVKRLKEKHADKNPHHYTIQDVRDDPAPDLIVPPGPRDLEDAFLDMIASATPIEETVDETPDYLKDPEPVILISQ